MCSGDCFLGLLAILFPPLPGKCFPLNFQGSSRFRLIIDEKSQYGSNEVFVLQIP